MPIFDLADFSLSLSLSPPSLLTDLLLLLLLFPFCFRYSVNYVQYYMKIHRNLQSVGMAELID